jgi:hypothetical protein
MPGLTSSCRSTRIMGDLLPIPSISWPVTARVGRFWQAARVLDRAGAQSRPVADSRGGGLPPWGPPSRAKTPQEVPLLADALVLLKLKRTHSPVRRTMQTHDSAKASARFCSASAVNSATLRTLAHITADKPGQPPSAAAYPSARSGMRRPSAVRPLTGRRRGSFVIREQLFTDLGMVAKCSTTRFSSKNVTLIRYPESRYHENPQETLEIL